jgi:ADP-L-glycero-D-manno-heptose 6-epimerase
MWIVTGATGFIGSALVWELNQRGREDLTLVDHVPPSERPQILKKRRFSDFVLAEQLFHHLRDESFAKKVAGVFHMGACSTTTETDETYLRTNNTEYTQKLFSFCTERRIPYIFASSGACYGDGKLGFDDATPSVDLRPLNLYGWSKVKADVWALEQKRSPPRWYALRFFNVYGPNEYHKGEQASVVFKAHGQIRRSGTLKLFKSHNPDYRDGEQKRDFVYVKDVTRWMIELMDSQTVSSGIYNMGFGTARTWLDLAQNTFAAMNKTTVIEWMEIPANIREQYQYFTEARMTRLNAAGLSPAQWSLERGVRDYVTNHLEQVDPYL